MYEAALLPARRKLDVTDLYRMAEKASPVRCHVDDVPVDQLHPIVAAQDAGLLVIEVANTSLHYDRTVKLPLQARSGTAEYWIVDLQRRAVDVYRARAADGYGEMATHQAGSQIALLLAPEIAVKLDVVFG